MSLSIISQCYSHKSWQIRNDPWGQSPEAASAGPVVKNRLIISNCFRYIFQVKICRSTRSRFPLRHRGFWEKTHFTFYSHFFNIPVTWHRLKCTQQYELTNRIELPEQPFQCLRGLHIVRPLFFSFPSNKRPPVMRWPFSIL
jgi:hypothetical protein